jgi:Periplasmic binding protein
MSRLAAALLAGAVLAASCTSDPPRSAPTSLPTEAPPETPSDAVEIALVAGPDAGSYLEGMEVAVRQVNASGGIDGVPIRLRPVDDLGARGGAPATLLVGRGEIATRLRPEIEAAGDPVVVLGDDLYSSRRLYRQVFQAGVPELWQARALARLLVRDLGLRDVRLLLGDRDTRAAYAAAFAEEGAALGTARGTQAVEGADAAIVPGSPAQAGPVVGRIATLPDPPLVALGSEGLGIETPLPVGTVAPYHYAWSGWAEPIARVARFRERSERRLDHLPEALQQEGYDAVRVLAEALARAGGRGGDALIRALEAVREATYSSLPLRLGPDDHVLLPQGQLGVFAVSRKAAPVEALAPNRWRPVMRTFTYNGERVTIVRRDLRVFFPSWRHPAPTPEYQRSRLGITSPAGTPPR